MKAASNDVNLRKNIEHFPIQFRGIFFSENVYFIFPLIEGRIGLESN